MNYTHPIDSHYYGWFFVFAVLRQHWTRHKLSEMWLVSALRLLKPIPEVWHLAAEELGRSGRWAASWERHGVRVLPPATILGIPVPSSLPETLQRPNSPSPVPPPPGGAIEPVGVENLGELVIEIPEEKPAPFQLEPEAKKHLKAAAWLHDSSIEEEAAIALRYGVAQYWEHLETEFMRQAKSQGIAIPGLLSDIDNDLALPPIPPDPRRLRDKKIVELRREGKTLSQISESIGCSIGTVRRTLKRRSTVTVPAVQRATPPNRQKRL